MERREFTKRVFVAPLVVTWAVTPSMARAGSQDVDEAPAKLDREEPRREKPRRRHKQSWWAWLGIG